jgi:hypothetical protein
VRRGQWTWVQLASRTRSVSRGPRLGWHVAKPCRPEGGEAVGEGTSPVVRGRACETEAKWRACEPCCPSCRRGSQRRGVRHRDLSRPRAGSHRDQSSTGPSRGSDPLGAARVGRSRGRGRSVEWKREAEEGRPERPPQLLGPLAGPCGSAVLCPAVLRFVLHRADPVAIAGIRGVAVT